MKLLIGDQEVELTDDDLEWLYINEGMESTVYQYGDEVLKIYTDFCSKVRLREDEAKRLSKISTKRFLLPQRIIYSADGKKFRGYTLKFISCASLQSILDRKVMDLAQELDVMEEDVDELSRQKVVIYDLNLDNTLYNGKIYIGDPGSFGFAVGTREGQIYRENMSELKRYVIEDLFGMVPTKRKKNIQTMNEVFDCYTSMAEAIRDTALEKESIKKYVKRMVS